MIERTAKDSELPGFISSLETWSNYEVEIYGALQIYL